jgi:hypothetical protein
MAEPVNAPFAVFICSTDLHVDLLGPVADHLERAGWRVALAALDPWYRAGADRRAAERGNDVVRLVPDPAGRRESAASTGGFYRRSTFRIWADVVRARRPIRAALASLAPTVVIVGNDRGLIEKLILHETMRLGHASVLVQDGHLGEAWNREPTLPRRAMRWSRRALSPIIRRTVAPYLAASTYGASGVDLICAAGAAGARILGRASAGRSKLVITGQPRYDRLAGRQVDRSDASAKVVWFPTPFQAANLGAQPQADQIDLVIDVAATLASNDRELVLKLHPRDDPGPYRRAVAEMGLALTFGADTVDGALGGASVAIVGISTVTEEAALLQVPVIVPGARIHGVRFEDVLPPVPEYPRFETGAEALSLIESLSTADVRHRLIAGQRAHVADRIDLDRVGSAAMAVADAIRDLIADPGRLPPPARS